MRARGAWLASWNRSLICWEGSGIPEDPVLPILDLGQESTIERIGVRRESRGSEAVGPAHRGPGRVPGGRLGGP